MELSVYGDGFWKFRTQYYFNKYWSNLAWTSTKNDTLLREAVGWRGYGQRNPLYEYKQDAFYMFETRKEVLRHLVIYDLLRSSIL
jgi:preprotein translocase subunit SecA